MHLTFSKKLCPTLFFNKIGRIFHKPHFWSMPIMYKCADYKKYFIICKVFFNLCQVIYQNNTFSLNYFTFYEILKFFIFCISASVRRFEKSPKKYLIFLQKTLDKNKNSFIIRINKQRKISKILFDIKNIPFLVCR